ncbi:hypothetical protein KKH36_02550 [Patescibacteria group bacterium]|nr:hypothetical protein [Patescibacteria group bacterium]
MITVEKLIKGVLKRMNCVKDKRECDFMNHILAAIRSDLYLKPNQALLLEEKLKGIEKKKYLDVFQEKNDWDLYLDALQIATWLNSL